MKNVVLLVTLPVVATYGSLSCHGLPLPKLSPPKLLQVRDILNSFFIPMKVTEMRVVKRPGKEKKVTGCHWKTISECSFQRLDC